MIRKLKQLGMLALAIGIFTCLGIMYGNKTEIQAGGGDMAVTSPINSTDIIDIDTPKLDNPNDMMYYHVFGERYKLMQEASKQINKTAYYDGLRLEILSTVTITEDGSLDYTSYTFFTVQDLTKNNRITSTTNLILKGYFNIPIGFGLADSISYNEETQTNTFLATYSHFDAETDDYLEHVPIKIESVIDKKISDNILQNKINLGDLISNHNASFTNNKILGSSSGVQLEELGLDFNELLNGNTLKKDELSIPIDGWDSAYISNIALIDNMLHIQTNTSERSKRIEWNYLNLIDDRTGNIITYVYSISLDNRDDDFNNANGRVYEEFVFFIEDINNINDYSLNLSRLFYDTNIETNLEISFLSPIIKNTYKTAEETEILIGSEKAKVNNVNMSVMWLNFDIYDYEIKVLEEDLNDFFEFISNNIEVCIIYNDGIKQIYSDNKTGIYWEYQEDSNSFNIINIHFSGAVIDVNNVESININGTVIEVN